MLVTTAFATDDGGIDPFASIPNAELADFFEHVRRFALAEPWDVLAHSPPIGVDIPDLGVLGGCAFLFGDHDGPRGMTFFRTYETFERFQKHMIEAENEGREPTLGAGVGASFLVLDFFSLHELCTAAIRRVAKNGLRVADDDSYAVPEALDAHGEPIELTVDDLNLVGAVLSSITGLLSVHRARLDGSEPVQALVESPGALVAVVEFPHPRWVEVQPVPSEGPQSQQSSRIQQE